MQGEAFAIVEANPETPFLPVDAATGYFEGWTLRLNDLIRLGRCPGAWPQIWMVLALSGGMDVAPVEGTPLIVDAFIWCGWQAIDLGNLELLGNLGTQIQGVCVVVGVWVIMNLKIEPALGLG